MLGFIVARALYERFPQYTEGELSKIRAHVVSRRSCAVVARDLGLRGRLEERGQIGDDLRRSANVLAALMEAALAALYMEYGIDEIAEPVMEAFAGRVEQALTMPVDHKTSLQEELAKSARRVEYHTITTEGPPHERRFTCAAIVDGDEAGRGTGSTKKAAEQEAAKIALARLGLAPARA